MMLLFTTPIGWAFVILALLLDIAGGIVILKIVKDWSKSILGLKSVKMIADKSSQENL